MMFKKQYMW